MCDYKVICESNLPDSNGANEKCFFVYLIYTPINGKWKDSLEKWLDKYAPNDLRQCVMGGYGSGYWDAVPLMMIMPTILWNKLPNHLKNTKDLYLGKEFYLPNKWKKI